MRVCTLLLLGCASWLSRLRQRAQFAHSYYVACRSFVSSCVEEGHMLHPALLDVPTLGEKVVLPGDC